MASGKLKIVVKKKADPIVTQNVPIISVREENNVQDVTFSYQNFDAANLTNNQILYQEGLPNDPSQTYIVIASQNNQIIGTSPGSFDLHFVSNGVGDQLDKTINLTIGTNIFSVYIDFRSRPDTDNILKEVPNYTVPVIISQQDILDHCSDFDGDQIMEWALQCGSDPNFSFGGQPYVSGTFLPMNQIDTQIFKYTPEVNSNGYTVEYPHLVKDSTGLITRL